MNRRGWTFVELMIVVTMLAVLTTIAIPALRDARRRAEATAALGDFNAIRAAAYDQFAANGTYPADGAWGVVPAAFVGSLPNNFSFQKGALTYRWRRWSLPNGMPTNPATPALLGVQVQSTDAELLKRITELWAGPQFGDNTQVTLVIE